MKIYRNGVEIELTAKELREAYYEQDHNFMIDDVSQKAKELGVDLTETDISWAASAAMDYIEHNDPYFEAYWYCVEEAINDCKGE